MARPRSVNGGAGDDGADDRHHNAAVVAPTPDAVTDRLDTDDPPDTDEADDADATVVAPTPRTAAHRPGAGRPHTPSEGGH